MLSKITMTVSAAFVLGAVATTLVTADANAKTNPTARIVTQPRPSVLPKQTDTNPSNGSLDWVIDHAKVIRARLDHDPVQSNWIMV